MYLLLQKRSVNIFFFKLNIEVKIVKNNVPIQFINFIEDLTEDKGQRDDLRILSLFKTSPGTLVPEPKP